MARSSKRDRTPDPLFLIFEKAAIRSSCPESSSALMLRWERDRKEVERGESVGGRGEVPGRRRLPLFVCAGNFVSLESLFIRVFYLLTRIGKLCSSLPHTDMCAT